MSFMKFEIDRFSGRNNFNIWKIQMMVLLQREGSIHTIDGKYLDGISASDKEKIEVDALSVIQMSLAPNVLCEVTTSTEETTKQLWDKLQGLYQDRSVTTRMLLQQHLHTFNMGALCKDLFNQWSNLDDSRFSIETVSGGITNLLLKVSVREDDAKDENMTVRLYGPNTEYVINRERELQAIQHLSVAGFGAKLLGVFGNGMVQSFIDARTLTPSDMKNPKLAAEIAKQLRKFHQVEIPGSKEPQVWNDVLKFFKNASTLQFDNGEKKIKYETISFQEVHDEIIELKELTDRLNAPVVFAHNDLLSGNLMLNEDKEKLYFIDFEYGSYNYRGFDIGNHFNEYAGYDCDYSLYPSKDEQFHFFRHYLDSDQPNEVPGKDLEALYVETNSYMLASHLYWALWALIQAKMSPIDFDYISYFFMRYNEYKKQKENYFCIAKSYLSKPELGERFI